MGYRCHPIKACSARTIFRVLAYWQAADHLGPAAPNPKTNHALAQSKECMGCPSVIIGCLGKNWGFLLGGAVFHHAADLGFRLLHGHHQRQHLLPALFPHNQDGVVS